MTSLDREINSKITELTKPIYAQTRNWCVLETIPNRSINRLGIMCILMTVAVVVNLSTEKLSQVLERVRPKFRVKIRNDK